MKVKAAHVAGVLPALSDVKLYVLPSHCPVEQMLQHLSTRGWLNVPVCAPMYRLLNVAPYVFSYSAPVCSAAPSVLAYAV